MTGSGQTILPRWRGFNLLDMFTTRSSGDFEEDDFRWMADWGFNFTRIPACYTLWIEDADVYKLHEPMLAKIDRVIDLGQHYGIHISFNFHRGPGYSVNRERQEPFNLWKDQEALEAFVFHWETLAKRYRGISSEKLSFDLVNEPPSPSAEGMTREDHARVARAAVAAIRAIDPDRLIIADGLGYGRLPMPELIDLGIAQSCRAYEPMGVSHYKADWVQGEAWPTPQWPGGWHYGAAWTRTDLEAAYAPWAEIAAQGVGVHCGEGGAFRHTPHPVVLAWFRDVLEILTGHNIGFALWNFRGSFGILDSGRSDVAYEAWHGHELDRALLSLLQEF
ncbi:MAG: cellulase family glycosylhydrolase [Anaerolineae bacterium]|nr:cellulase family glycosylhydrolase [Anaerolineae bacterium]